MKLLTELDPCTNTVEVERALQLAKLDTAIANSTATRSGWLRPNALRDSGFCLLSLLHPLLEISVRASVYIAPGAFYLMQRLPKLASCGQHLPDVRPIGAPGSQQTLLKRGIAHKFRCIMMHMSAINIRRCNTKTLVSVAWYTTAPIAPSLFLPATLESGFRYRYRRCLRDYQIEAQPSTCQ
jgi:hypothetical protein